MLNIKLFVLIVSLLLLSCNETKIVQQNFPNGNIKESYMLHHGKYQGQYKAYYENGKLWGEGNYKNNQMDGLWVYYYNDGKKMSKQLFKKGQLVFIDAWDKKGNLTIKNGTGTTIVYSSTGNKLSEVTYKNCIREGKWTSWFENGNKESEICFKNGKPEGNWTFWNINGEIVKIEKYEEGLLKGK